MNPFLAMAIVCVAFAALMVPCLVLRKRRAIGAEASRKAVHIGMGLVTLAFPWLFRDTWPVFLLTGGFVALLLALRVVPSLRDRFGEALCGVGRLSLGEVYFPIAIGALFGLTHDEPVNYVIPVLILTFADAAAALAGSGFGRHRYLADEGEKSWEGSLAFFVVAFVCVYAALLVSGSADAGRGALIALCIALVTMLLEATAWRGLDNLFVPLATLLMLRLYRDLPPVALGERLGVLVILAALHSVCRSRALLREGTLFGALLAIYLCWIFGSPLWVLAPMLLLAAHPLIALGARREAIIERQSHHALLSLGLPPLAWLFLGRFFGVPSFWPFHATFAAQLALTAIALWQTGLRRRGLWLVPPAAAIGWCAFMMPWWLAGLMSHTTAALSAIAVVLSTLIFHCFQARLDGRPIRHWGLRGILATLASFSALP